MADDTEPNGGEVSDGMSENENEYDELDDSQMKDDDDKMTDQNLSPDGATEIKKKFDPKDPLRPRRRKARRACYACQRAHLTCGDERPCQRCIKRGLADQCQDGVRKKAKYLHDAPPEALGPVLGPNFNSHSSHSTRPNGHRQPPSVASEASSNVTAYLSQPSAASSFAVFSPQTHVTSLPESLPFATSQQSPISPTFHGHGHPPQIGGLTVPHVSGEMPNFSSAFFDPSNPAIFNFNLEGLNFGNQYGAMEFSMLGHMSSGAAETPPRDPSISQNGAGDITFGSGLFGSSGGGGGGVNFDKLYDSNPIGELFGLEPSAGGLYAQGNLQHGLPHAYAIAAGPSSLQSPSTENNSPQPTPVGFDGSPTTAGTYGSGAGSGGNAATTPGGAATTTAPQGGAGGSSIVQPQPHRPKPKPSATATAAAKFGPQSVLGKRPHRDSSHIYETVKEPYMYVSGFHRLIALLQRRLSASKVLRVAKSLASIRPSFIACTRTLSRADLVFMEKSFQRQLFEFEDFMHQTSSPAVLCRRTGEVVAVNKEFTALTGWRRDVMLGKEPNLNVNTGNSSNSMNTSATTSTTTATNTTNTTSSSSNSNTSSSNSNSTSNNSSSSSNSLDPSAAPANSIGNTSSGRVGLSTPRLRSLNADMSAKASQTSGPQPLFIAELMDDDSVIQFYEDFAQLAFEDSRGRVNRKARLLKYRTAAQQQRPGSSSIADRGGGGGSGDMDAVVKTEGALNTSPQQHHQSAKVDPRKSILSNRVARIDGEHGISKIERDGKLECSYCWHIRRDMFDIPMMIVMNFLPCYYPNQEPHQLAV